MEFSIENIPKNRIAYIRKIGPYGLNNVSAMEELKKWASSKNLLDDQIIYGIAQYNPHIISSKHCRYDTCITLPMDFSISDNDILEGSIIGGKYAVYKIDHTAEAVQKAWIIIFSELLKRGYQYDESRPIIERYKPELLNNDKCEICLPIF